MYCAVIGLGNIGSAVYNDLAQILPNVIGVDISEQRVAYLQQKGVRATTELSACAAADVFIICASTGAKMENIYSIAASLSPKSGALICVESTLLVNTMNSLAQHFINRGYIPGENIHLVHAPHRIMIGHDLSTIAIPRVVGGITERCLQMGVEFYTQLGTCVVPVPDICLAELSKLVENSLRYVEVAFAEALASYCAANNLDFHLLRQAVNSKGNVHLKNVDYGIGGECLPKDILFLQAACPAPILMGAQATDEQYRDDLRQHILSKGRRVLIRGVGYKPGSSDISHSHAINLALALHQADCEVSVCDPLVNPLDILQAGLTPAYQSDTSEYDIIVERGHIHYQ